MAAEGAVGATPRPTGAVLAVPLAGVTFFTALNLSSNLAQTSDSAQGFVVGHAIATGNALLGGWHFPIDNFYFTDALPYAAAEWIVGPRPWLLALVPAVVYTLFVLLVLIACFRQTRSPGRISESACAIALLLVEPAWIGDWNPMLMSNMHAATVLAAFAALMLCASAAQAELITPLSRSIAACFVLLVCLIVASDPFSLVFAFAPAACVLVIGSVRKARPRAHIALALLATGVAAGLLLPTVIAELGGFTIENDVSVHISPLSHWPASFIDLMSGAITLLRANPLDVHDLLSAVIFGIHCVGLVLVLYVIIRVAQMLLCREDVPLLDQFLLVSGVALLLVCIPSAQFAKGVKPATIWHGGPPMRFVMPAVLFAAVLSGRQVSNILDMARNSKRRLELRGIIIVAAGTAVSLGVWQSSRDINRTPWIAHNRALDAVRWLKLHELSQGAGEYWSANLLTALSGNAIIVRSVIPGENHKLAPYIWVEDRGYYAKSPQFVVWEEPNQTGIDEKLVRATYPICGIDRVNGYRVALLRTSHDSTHCS